MDNTTKKKWPVIVAGVFGVFVVGIVATLITLFLLSGTSTGQAIRDRLGLKNFQTFSINSTKTEKIVVEESSAIIDTAKKVNPAVVSIVSGQMVQTFYGLQNSTSSGSGFIVTSDGLIATNKHVVSGGTSFTITTAEGKTYEGKVVATDPVNDLALIKIDASGLPVVELADSDQTSVGQWVVAIGNALGEFQNTVTVGVISAKDRQVTPTDSSTGATESLDGLIQTDAAINSGNSGGPLLTLQGQVIGINTAVAGSAQNIGFAIPANELRKDLDSYRKNGKIVRAQIGVRYVTVTKLIAKELSLKSERGALVYASSGAAAVTAGSPADKAGLKAGDIIIKVNSDDLTESNPLSREIRKFNAGDKITITYIRDGKEQTTDLTLGSVSS